MPYELLAYEKLIIEYKVRILDIENRCKFYNTHSNDYSNEVIKSIFDLLDEVKDLKKAISNIKSELLKIDKNGDLLIDIGEISESVESLHCEITDTINLISNINSNDTNNLMKKLTTITVVFTPLNLLAGMGGMSEWSAFVTFLGISPFIGYSLFFVWLGLVAAFTIWMLNRK